MIKNLIEQQQPLLKNNNHHAIEIKDHNYLFTKISSLIKQIYTQKEKIQNEQMRAYITRNTRVDLIIERVNRFEKE